MEAARGGFGKLLWDIANSNQYSHSKLRCWGTRIIRALVRGEEPFSKPRPFLRFVDDFPDPKVVRYYTHPSITPAEALERKLRDSWNQSIDVAGLRDFTDGYFDWKGPDRNRQFIKAVAPARMAHELTRRAFAGNTHFPAEQDLIGDIMGKRGQADLRRKGVIVKDGRPAEIKIQYVPQDIVNTVALDDKPGYKWGTSDFDPDTSFSDWIPAWLVERGARRQFREWAADGRTGKKRKVSEPSEPVRIKQPRKKTTASAPGPHHLINPARIPLASSDNAANRVRVLSRPMANGDANATLSKDGVGMIDLT